MPLGFLFALATYFVAPGFGGGEGQISDARSALGRADFRIAPDIAEQNNLVDGTHAATISGSVAFSAAMVSSISRRKPQTRLSRSLIRSSSRGRRLVNKRIRSGILGSKETKSHQARPAQAICQSICG